MGTRPTDQNLDHSPDHQRAAAKSRWAQATNQQRARHLVAVAEGMLRRARELETTGDTFSATPAETPNGGRES